MLFELYVENIALLRQVRLSLCPGMNALTGETGAGKSLVVDAVSLLIGGRGSDGFIRSGEERALVEGVFMPPFPRALTEALDDPSAGEDNLILSRELIRGGRSLARLNGRSIPLSRLRELGRLLINIHGQHEHTLLLEEERQLALVDGFGGAACARALSRVGQAWSNLVRAGAALKDYEQNAAQRGDRLAQLAELIEEIENAAPRRDEVEELQGESHLLTHGERLYGLSDQAHELLACGGGAVERLNEAAALLRQASSLDKSLDPLADRMSGLFYELEDAANEIAAYRDRLNINAWRLDEVESRLALLGRLSKKYGGDIEAVLRTLAEAKAEQERLEEIVVSGDRFQQELSHCQEEYDRAAACLRQERQAAALKLGEAITHELRMLAMPQAQLTIELPTCAAGSRGTESAVFMIRPNVGEPAQPVARIASGGELSRILLGIKVILAQADAVPTMVFDEIDTGMSGRALLAVADRLRLVSRYAQTIAVSHNPIIAAAAHSQVVVEKQELEGRTLACCRQLGREERPAELSRMIAGDRAGESAIAQAEEMLALFKDQ